MLANSLRATWETDADDMVVWYSVIHSILFVIRCRDAYRTKFWRQPWHFPTGEYTLQFTVKLAKQPQREEGTV